MLLESLKSVIIPNSNSTLLIFPFDRCNIKFRRHVINLDYLEGKYTLKQINEVIDNVEKVCEYFWNLKKYILLTIFASILYAICLILGGVFLNVGLGHNQSSTDIDFVKYDLNQFVIAGGVILGLGSALYAACMIWIGFKSRQIRCEYESKTEAILLYYNEKIKENGMKWRLGDQYRWIELRLEFKIKIIQEQMPNTNVIMPEPIRDTKTQEQNPKNIILEEEFNHDSPIKSSRHIKLELE